MGKFLLKGDISGIQGFIFNVNSDGAAKTLKARSYFVQILGYTACQFVLEKLENGEKFYEGGGSFFITFEAKDEDKANSKVNTIKDELHKHQIDGDLLIYLSSVSLEDKEFGNAWLELRQVSNRDRLLFFGKDMKFFEPFNKDEFEINSGKFPEAVNRIKERSEIKDENLFKALTEVMVKKEKIWVKLFEKEFTKESADFDFSLTNKLPFWGNYTEFEQYKLFRQKNIHLYKDVHGLEDEADKPNIIDFDALADFAAHRTGTGKLGILKLDVDNLGKIFGQANGKAKEYSDAISKFFTRTIYTELYKDGKFQLSDCDGDYKANIYPIFTGGDDCFIIGGWDALLCFAKDLHEKFTEEEGIKKILCDNKPVTISAGIVIVNSTHPVRHFAELVEEALTKSKNSGKNGITLFGLTFTWDEYGYILNTAKEVAKEMREKNISRAYLDKIRKSAKGFDALQNRGGADFDRIYKLRYYLSKNNEKLQKIVDLLFDPYYETLKNKLLNNEDRIKYDVSVYPAIARITEFLTKEKLDYGKE